MVYPSLTIPKKIKGEQGKNQAFWGPQVSLVWDPAFSNVDQCLPSITLQAPQQFKGKEMQIMAYQAHLDAISPGGGYTISRVRPEIRETAALAIAASCSAALHILLPIC